MSDKPEKKDVQSLSQKALGGVSVMGLTVGTQMALQLISIAVLARILTPTEFGIVAAANIVIAFSNMFSDIALGSAIIQLKDITEKHIRVAFTLSMASSLFVAMVLIFSAPYIAVFFEMPEITNVIKVLAIVFLWTGLSMVSENLMSRSFRYTTLGLIKVSGSITGITVTISLALMGYSYWSIVIGVMVQSFQAMVLMMIAQKHSCRPSCDLQSMKDLMIVGGGLSMSRIINYAALNADNFFIAKFIGAESLGFYDRAYRLAGFPAQIFDKVAAKVALSSYARAQEDKARMNFAYRRGLSLTALVAMPLTFVLWALGPEIILIVLGSKWEAAIMPFVILVSATFFRVSYKVSQSVIISVGRVYVFAGIQMLYAVMVGLGCYLAYPHGIESVAYAVTGSIIMNFVMLSYCASNITNLSLLDFLKTIMNGIIITALLAVIILPVLFLLRSLLSPILVFLLTSALIGFFAIFMLVKPYKWLWGDSGLWLREQVLSVLEKKLPHAMKKLY